MASHKTKVITAKIIIILAALIYVLSFFYTGFTGYAIIGTSVSILPDPSNVTVDTGDFSGTSNGGAVTENRDFFSGFCINRIVLQEHKQIAIDTTLTPRFCVAIKSAVYANPFTFSGVIVKNLHSITQLDITSYPANNKKSYVLSSEQLMPATIGNNTPIFVRSTTGANPNLNTNYTVFFNKVNNSADAVLLLSIDEKMPVEKNQSLDDLFTTIQTAKQNLDSNTSNNSVVTNASLAYLMQQVQVVELDENDRVINKTKIPLVSLPDYTLDSNAKRIAIHWQNESLPWLVFSRTTTSIDELAKKNKNYTLQEFSKDFLLETKGATIVPAQLEVFRTVLLGVVSIGFLSLHNLSLRKEDETLQL